jgi:O-Antigen ligase
VQSLPSASADTISFEAFRKALLWLMFATSFAVKFEPAPCDLVFFAAFGCYLLTGLRVPTSLALLGFLLLVYNFGGFLSYLPVMDQPKTGTFVVISIYMALSALFLCSLLSEHTQERFNVIANGWIVSGAIASALAIAGFFNLAGLASVLTVADRATGLFKDPNVFSTFINLPMVLLAQRFLIGSGHSKLFTGSVLLLVLAALFLAFSRGAWVSAALSLVLMMAITFLSTDSSAIRLRTIIVVIGGSVALAVMLFILLSIPAIRDLFLERATLNQSYDVGETGRFGSQINSIPLLLQRPFGFGPLQYSSFMGQDPHNTFLNAFASYGWLGGVTYVSLIGITVVIGTRTIMMRSPWRSAAIAVFSSQIALIFQGVQIDTDHWRHFYWLMGLMWGLFGAALAFSKNKQRLLPGV